MQEISSVLLPLSPRNAADSKATFSVRAVAIGSFDTTRSPNALIVEVPPMAASTTSRFLRLVT